MDERIIKFLKRHRISVLTTLLKNGTPHSASLHYAFDEEDFSFIFFTDITSRKMENLTNGESSPASLVIGFSEEEWLTVQMEGEIKWLAEKSELSKAWDVYASKFRGAENNREDNNSAILLFKPKWWRYTEVKPYPQVILSSDDLNSR